MFTPVKFLFAWLSKPLDSKYKQWTLFLLFPLMFIWLRALYWGLAGNDGGNQAMYYLEAVKLWQPSAFSSFSAVIAESYVNILTDSILYWGSQILGTELFYFAGRILIHAAMLWALWRVSKAVGMHPLTLPAALGCFVVLGQNFIASSWIFSSLEAKVFAYLALFWSLERLLHRQWRIAIILCVVATYAHFQVGLYWTAFLGLALLWQREIPFWQLVKYGMMYTLACVPLLILIAWEQLAAAPAPPGINTDWIYSIWRHPHHTAPFVSQEMWAQFKPGIILLGLTGIYLLWHVAQQRAGQAHLLLRLSCIVWLWTVIMLVLSYFTQESGVLGKFYVFRPNSLLLLLVLLLIMQDILPRLPEKLTYLGALLCGIVLAGICMQSNVVWTQKNIEYTANAHELLGYINQSSLKGEVIALGSGVPHNVNRILEPHVPTYVKQKFVPTKPAEIAEWYQRYQAREALLAGDCEAAPIVKGIVLPANHKMPACFTTQKHQAGDFVLYMR